MRFFSSVLLGLLSIVNAAPNVQQQPQRSSMIEYRDLDPEGIPPQHRAGLGIESHFNLQAEAAATWNYKRNDLANGPATWATSGDPQCGGKSQSPIDIATTTTSYDAKLPPLKATFGTYKNITVINNGHTVQVSPATGDTSSSFSGGSLNGTYNVIQFHFHQISEHTVNGAGFAAELHIVGLNADPLHQADTDPLQLAVIGVFLQENPTPTATPHPVLQSILAAAKAGGLATIGNTANLDINMKTLWATDNPAFWTYPGSLTAPNCRETVTWHVLRDPLFVNAAQLYELRTYLGNDETGKYNNRITMPLGTRVVRTNVLAVANNKGSASTNSVTGALTMIAAFASTFLARFF